MNPAALPARPSCPLPAAASAVESALKSLQGASALHHLGVIRAQGPQAAQFLHAQLTNDVALLASPQPAAPDGGHNGPSSGLADQQGRIGQWRLAAWCNAKGRMLASFWLFKPRPDEVLLITPLDTLAATLGRLSMFVLRAQVKLSDASADYRLIGLLSQDTIKSIVGAAVTTPQFIEFDAKSLLALPPAALAQVSCARALLMLPAGAAACPMPPPEALTAALARLPPATPQQWLWAEVMSGIAPVLAATAQAFVPQMLNYESVGGVNFKKGCYPGQEVVARSQFRGTLKRRAYIAACAAPLAAGQDLFHSADASQPAGTVALAAPSPSPSPAGGCHAIVSLQTAAAESGTLRATAPDGPPLTLLPLPYTLLDDV